MVDYLKEPEITNITHDNIKNIKIQNIVSFSFATLGAMGDGGALIIAHKEKDFKLYYFNLCNKDDTLVDKVLDSIFLELIGQEELIGSEQSIDLDFVVDVPNFECILMGFGNKLYVRKEFIDQFMAMCLKFDPQILYSVGRLYKKQKIVMNLFFNPELEKYKRTLIHCKVSPVWGSIIGDIVGSRFEFRPHRNKNFDLFYSESENKIPKTVSEYRHNSRFTDDTVMTIAVAQSLMEVNEDYDGLEDLTIKNMKQLGKKYPFAGYGARFNEWLQNQNPEPYNSFGNGSAMRISAVPYFAEDMDTLQDLVCKVTNITHNHPEGIKGACAVADCIWLAYRKFNKEYIKQYVEENYYNLDFDYDDLIQNYKFDETCQGSVPQSIFAFLISDSFEDAIRTAVSMGGDSDTMGAITGAISGAYYGISDDIINKSREFLTSDILEIVDKLEDKFNSYK